VGIWLGHALPGSHFPKMTSHPTTDQIQGPLPFPQHFDKPAQHIPCHGNRRQELVLEGISVFCLYAG
jgi:hypothetical protein